MSWHKISQVMDELPPTEQANPINTAKVEPDEGALSDASTVVDGHELDCTQGSEQFPFLEELRTQNLLQYSQVSDLARKENIDLNVKPNLEVLPTMEDHDCAGYKFHLKVRPEKGSKANWFYAESLNKVYLRMNDLLSIAVVYTPKPPFDPLMLRIFPCFTKEVSEPVLRCANHIKKDATTPKDQEEDKRLHSLLRCENPQTIYNGHAAGKNITERFSVIVQLNNGIKPQRDKSVSHPIELKFACQNSCIGRKETSLVFLLETKSGEVLAQRILNIKICSCPKRDCGNETRNQLGKRRRSVDDSITSKRTTVKRPKEDIVDSSQCLGQAPVEDCLSYNSGMCDVQRTSDGGYRIVLETSYKDVAQGAIKGALNELCHRTLADPKSGYAREYPTYLRTHDKLCNK